MTDLEPCPSCRRHVRIDEVACPFCAAALPALGRGAIPRRPRARAIAFAGATLLSAAACGGKAKPTDQKIENASIDAGPGDEAAAPDAEPYVEPPYDDHDVKMPYGAPPVRARVV